MSLSDYKLSDADIARSGVVAAPDRLTGTAAENKAVFDRLIREKVKELLNGMIDELLSASGAENIGISEIPDVAGTNVDAVLRALKALIDTKSTDADITAALAAHYVTAGKKSGTTLGTNATAEGYDTTASGEHAHAEGTTTTASESASHAEGAYTTASGDGSHAEGWLTTASGDNSHAEGYDTDASGNDSHAEGVDTTASAVCAHAEGWSTTASGNDSHAEGYNTTANHKSQHVFGENNIPDDSTAGAGQRGNYVEIVGNGTGDSAKSNARTLDWYGNEVLAGKLTLGAAPAANMDAATKKYVDDAIAALRAELGRT